MKIMLAAVIAVAFFQVPSFAAGAKAANDRQTRFAQALTSYLSTFPADQFGSLFSAHPYSASTWKNAVNREDLQAFPIAGGGSVAVTRSALRARGFYIVAGDRIGASAPFLIVDRASVGDVKGLTASDDRFKKQVLAACLSPKEFDQAMSLAVGRLADDTRIQRLSAGLKTPKFEGGGSDPAEAQAWARASAAMASAPPPSAPDRVQQDEPIQQDQPASPKAGDVAVAVTPDGTPRPYVATGSNDIYVDPETGTACQMIDGTCQ